MALVRLRGTSITQISHNTSPPRTTWYTCTASMPSAQHNCHQTIWTSFDQLRCCIEGLRLSAQKKLLVTEELVSCFGVALHTAERKPMISHYCCGWQITGTGLGLYISCPRDATALPARRACFILLFISICGPAIFRNRLHYRISDCTDTWLLIFDCSVLLVMMLASEFRRLHVFRMSLFLFENFLCVACKIEANRRLTIRVQLAGNMPRSKNSCIGAVDCSVAKPIY